MSHLNRQKVGSHKPIWHFKVVCCAACFGYKSNRHRYK